MQTTHFLPYDHQVCDPRFDFLLCFLLFSFFLIDFLNFEFTCKSLDCKFQTIDQKKTKLAFSKRF